MSGNMLRNEQDAIRLAVEAGYDQSQLVGMKEAEEFEPGRHRSLTWQEEKTIALILQDPVMWIALGKARGWILHKCQFCGREDMDTHMCACPAEGLIYPWLYYALRYFETRLSNGNMQAYWQNIP